MNFFGQLTQKDCWLSSTVLAIFLVIDYIPNLIVKNNETVKFPNGRKIILASRAKNYYEAVIRATRVYFSDPKRETQCQFDISDINYRGCPDLVSNLFFGTCFESYCTSYISFYSYISFETCKFMLEHRNHYDIFLITFTFNVSHLYVYINIDSESDIINVLDISSGKCVKNNIPINKIHILMKLLVKI